MCPQLPSSICLGLRSTRARSLFLRTLLASTACRNTAGSNVFSCARPCISVHSLKESCTSNLTDDKTDNFSHVLCNLYESAHPSGPLPRFCTHSDAPALRPFDASSGLVVLGGAPLGSGTFGHIYACLFQGKLAAVKVQPFPKVFGGVEK